MKKKLLLILMFMTMFIVGNKSANALECEYVNIKTGAYLVFDTGNNMISWYDIKEDKSYDVPAGKNGIFYEDSNIFSNKTWKFVNHLVNKYEICPEQIYLYSDDLNINKNYDFYDYKSSELLDKYGYNSSVSISEYKLKKNSGNISPNEDVDDCQLLSDGVIKMINDIMNVIRIAIPLLLIGLIIYDFAIATFASDDKAANKSKQNVIKRIIIAVIIFFVPMFINLVFNLVNEVWANTHLEICGIDEE